MPLDRMRADPTATMKSQYRIGSRKWGRVFIHMRDAISDCDIASVIKSEDEREEGLNVSDDRFRDRG